MTVEMAAWAAALRWHVDEGAAEAIMDRPGLRAAAASPADRFPETQHAEQPYAPQEAAPAVIGSSALCREAARLAGEAETLEALKAAIEGFDGLSLKKTATSIVFADGLPGAHVMLIGDAPGTDDDRSGRPFAGDGGVMLDRILAWIGLDRADADPASSIYLSCLLNWRPPGNRTPNPSEIEISLPFIERHIALAAPRCLVLAGGATAQTLLGLEGSVSKLRGSWHAYRPRSGGAGPEGRSIPALVTHNPARLAAAAAHKRAVWQDMLMLKERLDGGA